MKKIAFCSATAYDRKQEAEDLFASIKLIYPNSICYFDAIDYPPVAVDELQKMGVVVNQFSSEIPPSMFNNFEGRKKIARKDDPAKGYTANTALGILCAAWRLFMLPRIMNSVNLPLMWLDTDCLIRDNIDEFINSALKKDVAFVIRPKRIFVVLSAVFTVNSTLKGKEYLNSLEDIYKCTWEKEGWGADPITLFKAIQKINPSVHKFDARQYADTRFMLRSKIWHSKHKPHRKSHPVWVNELKRIRKLWENG